MSVDKLALPAGIGVAALCMLGVVALVLRSRRSREQDKMSAEDRERLANERRKSWRRRLAVTSLSIAFLIIFCIAGIAAWLSFGAQKAYAFDRNGGSWDAATGFALLLDAGALGLSLLRLFEALTARSSQLTRFYLVAFVVASATMNLLHAPSPSVGGRLVAVIPPLVYAVFLETLLKKVEQLVLGKYPKRRRKDVERGYSLWLWVPFVGYPWQMWTRWREDLHDTLQYVRAPGSRKPIPSAEVAAGEQAGQEVSRPMRPAAQVPTAGRSPAPRSETPALAQQATAVPKPRPVPHSPAASGAAALSSIGATSPIGGMPPTQTVVPAAAPAAPVTQPQPIAATVEVTGDKPKKELLREALVAQILAGDLTVLDSNSQIANGAAYRANMELGKAAGKGQDRRGKQEGLMADGAVRTAVKNLLPELRRIAQDAARARKEGAAVQLATPEPAGEHGTPAGETAGHDMPRERREEVPVIGHQRGAGTSEESKEAALT